MADISGWGFVIWAWVIFVVFLLAILVMFKKYYLKVEQGTALIINGFRSKPRVTFSGGFVWPIVNFKELMKISLIFVKTICAQI